MEENQVVQEHVPATTVEETGKKERDNLVAMRKKLEAEEAARRESDRQRDEAIRYAEELKKGGGNSQNHGATQNVVDDEDPMDPEDYLQAKTFQKSTGKLKSKLSDQEKKLQAMQDKLDMFEVKSELGAIKDFYEVVTDENIKTFARLYPEDYQSVLSNPNVTGKTKTMYNMIKNYGISETKHRDVEDKIERNKQKPTSASLTGAQTAATPLSRLGDYERRVLTEQDRDRILAEVQRKKMGY